MQDNVTSSATFYLNNWIPVVFFMPILMPYSVMIMLINDPQAPWLNTKLVNAMHPYLITISSHVANTVIIISPLGM